MPRALVTGITGQDGQHLAELLHGEGYEVFGMAKGQNNPRIAGVLEKFPFIEPVSGDLADLSSSVKAVEVASLDQVPQDGDRSVTDSASQPECGLNSCLSVC